VTEVSKLRGIGIGIVHKNKEILWRICHCVQARLVDDGAEKCSKFARTRKFSRAQV